MQPQTTSTQGNDDLTFGAPVTQATPASALVHPSNPAATSTGDDSDLTFGAPVSKETPASTLQAPHALSANGQNLPPQTGTAGQMPPEAEAASQEAAHKWYNQDANGNPAKGNENGQQHTIRANDPQNAGTATARWAEQVSNDIKYGTDITGIGKFIKKMGAHGVDVGNPSGVGEWMASIPLGALRVVKGLGEVGGSTTPGQTRAGGAWQGVKDIVGGAGQAATMPTSVIAPESTELENLAGQAVDKVGDAANTVASKVGDAANTVKQGAAKVGRKIYPAKVTPEDLETNFQNTVKPIYDEAHQALRDAVSKTAADEGVTIKPSSASLRDVPKDAAMAIRAKADQGFQVMDNALEKAGFPGKFQQIGKDIEKLEDKYDNAIGDDNLQATLAEKIQSRQADLETAQEHLKDAGIPQEFVDSTVNTYKKSRALEDLHKLVNRSGVIDGTRPEMAGANATPESLNLDGFEKGLNDLYSNTKYGARRLQQALGNNASTLLTKAGDARSALKQAVTQAAGMAQKAKIGNWQRKIVGGYAVHQVAKHAGLEGGTLDIIKSLF